MTTSTSISSSEKVEDQMVFFSSQMYTHTSAVLPQHVESKPRRRRKKNKAVDDGQNRTLGIKKRKLSEEQVNFLEKSFGEEHKLESERKDKLASELDLDPRQVAVWFQNRRARWKTRSLVEEYNKLKSVHDEVVIKKSQLESEVLKLKQQLLEAEKDIQKLSERNVDGVSSTSSCSSLSMEQAMQAPFLEESGVNLEGYDYNEVLCMLQNSMDWFDFYNI